MSITDPQPVTTPTSPPGFAGPGESEPAEGSGGMLDGIIEQVGANEALDPLVAKVSDVASKVGAGQLGASLRGRELGHAIHPMLTDLPLACFTSANLLDLLGGRRARPAAQRLVGIGLLSVVPVALTGMAEYDRIDDDQDRRVGAAHAAGNWAMTGAFLMSWRARRKDRHVRGTLWGLLGGGLAAAAGALGGHLSFRRGVGVGDRTHEDGIDRGDAHLELSDEHVNAAIAEGLSTEAYYG